jgi:leucyl aminopeptidase (aminopeptidase T)
MAKLYEFELGKATDILMRDMFKLKEGETIVITADTESNENVVNSAARSAYSCGAKPMVIWTATPDGVGKAADPMLPVEALSAALCNVDAWVEFNNQWLLYSTPFEIAMEKNSRLRYLNLVGMDEDLLIRIIGKTDIEKLKTFMSKVTEMTHKASKVKVTTPAGTNIEFENEPSRKIYCDVGDASVPGMAFLPGQICWFPKFETINGTIVFDGSLTPPCGLLSEPIYVEIKDGVAVVFKGGRQAEQFKDWLASFDDPNMFRPVHISYGFGPNAKLTGNIVEDERVWGCTQWGFGYLSPMDAPPEGIPAKSHCDGICLNSSVWLDGKQILKDGKIVDEELARLAKKLGK